MDVDTLKAVAICGHVCSGKSSLVAYLSRSHHFDVVSFGDYVRHLATVQGLPSTRAVWLELGERAYRNRGPQGLLYDTLRFAEPHSNVHLLDGVRDPDMATAVRAAYGASLVVFLRVSDGERFSRYKARAARGDPVLSYEEFCELSRHPIEQHVSDIEEVADVLIDASRVLEQVVADVELLLTQRAFIGCEPGPCWRERAGQSG